MLLDSCSNLSPKPSLCTQWYYHARVSRVETIHSLISCCSQGEIKSPWTKRVEENNQNTKKNARNSLKNKTFILFLYRKAIKKQFAVYVDWRVRTIFPFTKHVRNLLFTLLLAPPRNDTLWFIWALSLAATKRYHISRLITSKTCLSRNMMLRRPPP